MDRRDFLVIGARAAAGASILSGAFREGGAALQPRGPTIVVGAGLAGLTAAYELVRAGLDVSLLEADSRPGGRVRTLRTSFSDGLHAEAGGQTFFPVVEDHAEPYLGEFGLRRAPPGPGGLDDVFVIRGRRVVDPGRADADWPLELSARERTLGLAGMRRAYLSPLGDLLGGDPGGWDWDALRVLDEISLEAAMRDRGASDDAIELLNLARLDFTALPARRHSALAAAVGLESFRRLAGRPYSIEGGNDRLTGALADSLREHTRYGARVTSISSSTSGVEVTCRTLAGEELIRGSRVICAIPPWAVSQIDFDPPLSREKQGVLAGLPVMSACRFYLQASTRVWRQEGLSGSATTDGPVSYLWESSPWLEGPRGILHGWLGQEASPAFERMTDAERAELGIREAEVPFPGIGDHVEGVDAWCWGSDPEVPGHFVLFPPGSFVSAALDLHRPEGRIHFAGTETAPPLLKGFLLGAIVSGRRAAGEVVSAEA